MVARVGDDLFGPATLQNFAARGIDTSHVQITKGISSGVAPIFVDSQGQNRILVVKGANDALRPADVDAAADLLRTADCIVMQLEIPLETIYYTLRLARERNIRTILNPAPAQKLDLEQLANADYVIPNETEAEALSGMPVNNLHQARACAGRSGYEMACGGWIPHARRQWRAAGQRGNAGAHPTVSRGSSGYHGRGRCLHRQLRLLSFGGVRRVRGHRARECLRGAVDSGNRHAIVVCDRDALRGRLG